MPSSAINVAGEWPVERAFAAMDQPSTVDHPDQAERLVSLSMPAPQIEALAILQATTHDQRFYWAAPALGNRPAETLAGSGVAIELATEPLLDNASSSTNSRFSAIRTQVQHLYGGSTHQIVTPAGRLIDAPPDHPARPRLFGGFAFSPAFVPDNTWSVFRPAHFTLPHFQFAEVHGEHWLTINAVFPGDESDDTNLAAGLQEALQTGYAIVRERRAAIPAPASGHFPVKPTPGVRYPMTFAQWSTMIDAAQDLMGAGALDKVVLARVAEVRRRRPVEPVTLLARLGDDYANSIRFLFEPGRDRFFLGATPELLVAINGNMLHSMALAGSIGRGRSVAEQAVLAAKLLASAKDRHEHQLVVDAVRERLGGHCDPLIVPAEPSVLTLHNIQHLLTSIQGQVIDRDRSDILALVELLHPTPALGGVPADRAVGFLTEAEPVPRGWYAAPVGWLDSRLDGSFAVAIRSAVCHYERAWLYAGAGIVPDSDAQREWDETELKFKPMLSAIIDEV